MPALLVDAREEELRPRAADALFVDLELLPRLRTRAVAHGDDVLAPGRVGGELRAGGGFCRRDTGAEIEEIALADRQDVHRLRVRESHVELEEFRALVRRHEAAVQDAFERRAPRGHRLDRPRHRLEGLIEILLRQEGQEVVRVAVRPHTACVRAFVSFVRALVVLGERHRHEGPSVAKRLEGELLPDELLLDQEPRCAPDFLLKNFATVRERLRLGREMVAPYSDAFPSRQAERLDDELEVGVVHELFESSEVIEGPKLRASRDLFASHELPRELLVRFELSRLARRADRRDPRGFKRIRDPLLERRLGADDREIDRTLLRPRDDALDRGHIAKEDILGSPPNPGILVRHRRKDVRVASMERLDDRMLAAPSPDHQHVHGTGVRKRGAGFLVSRTPDQRLAHLAYFGGCISLRKLPSESSKVTTLPQAWSPISLANRMPLSRRRFASARMSFVFRVNIARFGVGLPSVESSPTRSPPTLKALQSSLSSVTRKPSTSR